MIHLLHQGQQATDLSWREALASKPVEIVARQISDQCALVFAEGHFARNEQFKVF